LRTVRGAAQTLWVGACAAQAMSLFAAKKIVKEKGQDPEAFELDVAQASACPQLCAARTRRRLAVPMPTASALRTLVRRRSAIWRPTATT
jgi:hypothetical protein